MFSPEKHIRIKKNHKTYSERIDLGNNEQTSDQDTDFDLPPLIPPFKTRLENDKDFQNFTSQQNVTEKSDRRKRARVSRIELESIFSTSSSKEKSPNHLDNSRAIVNVLNNNLRRSIRTSRKPEIISQQMQNLTLNLRRSSRKKTVIEPVSANLNEQLTQSENTSHDSNVEDGDETEIDESVLNTSTENDETDCDTVLDEDALENNTSFDEPVIQSAGSRRSRRKVCPNRFLNSSIESSPKQRKYSSRNKSRVSIKKKKPRTSVSPKKTTRKKVLKNGSVARKPLQLPSTIYKSDPIQQGNFYIIVLKQI